MKSFGEFRENAHIIPHYTDWGWISPAGKLINGTEETSVRRHEDVLRKYGVSNMAKALRTGWVKWAKNYNDVKVEFFASEKVVRGLKDLLNTIKPNSTGIYTAEVWVGHKDAGIEEKILIRTPSVSTFLSKILKVVR